MAVQPQTDWLERAGRLQMCPLCLATSQYASNYLEALCDRLVIDDRDPVSTAALGDLCVDHMGVFEVRSREAGLNLRTVVSVHLRRLNDLAEGLSELDLDGWLATRECGLCLSCNELALACATGLLTDLARRGNPNASHLEDAGGLCASHFLTCWAITSAAADREALRCIQLAAVQRLAGIARSGASGEWDQDQLKAFTVRAVTITSM
ncbi:MAG TPA: hypothetical protein VKV21_03005 [Solirubrobacteraceae bacterium]|nr:hypothetical protein [Solirubrobacteraceae bacterium]